MIEKLINYKKLHFRRTLSVQRLATKKICLFSDCIYSLRNHFYSSLFYVRNSNIAPTFFYFFSSDARRRSFMTYWTSLPIKGAEIFSKYNYTVTYLLNFWLFCINTEKCKHCFEFFISFSIKLISMFLHCNIIYWFNYSKRIEGLAQ